AAMAKELHAASGYGPEDLAPYFPGGKVPETSTADHLVAELFDPFTYVPGGIVRSALLNALSSAARPYGYEDESSALERALLGAAATPAMAAGLRGVGRAAGGALQGAGRLASAAAQHPAAVQAMQAAGQAARPVGEAVSRAMGALGDATARVEAERAAYREVQDYINAAHMARLRGRPELAEELLREAG